MITELEYECRRKGHGKLHQLEVNGLFYTYCPDCVRKTVYQRDFYDFLGISRERSLQAYLETEGYMKKNGMKCYKEDWEKKENNNEYTSGSTRKLIEAIRN